MSRQTVSILGVSIDTITMSEAATAICNRGKTNDAPVYVSKPYVEFLDRASTDPEIGELLNGSYLTLPDSVAVQWAAHYLAAKNASFGALISSLAQIILNPKSLKNPIPERFAGADFAWRMLEQASHEGLSIYLIGHPKGKSIDHTAQTIIRKLPKLRVAGTFDGYAVNNLEADLIKDLKSKQPDLILVGTGFPRQERLMARLCTQLERGVLVGEGGTFDYESFGGTIRRAPRWMRSLGLEWLWRLIIEPSRITRQIAIPRFVWKLYKAKKNA